MSNLPNTNQPNNTVPVSDNSSAWGSCGSGSGSGYSTTSSSRARAVRRPRSPTPQPPACLLSSDRSDSDFGRGWSSGSLFGEGDEEDEIDEESEPIATAIQTREPEMYGGRTSSSSTGSGDKMSDEDKERLAAVRRGENRYLEEWFKELSQQISKSNGTIGEFWEKETETSYPPHSLPSSTSSGQDDNGSSESNQLIRHQFYAPSHQHHSNRKNQQRYGGPTASSTEQSTTSGSGTNATTENTNSSTATGKAIVVSGQQRKHVWRPGHVGGNANAGGGRRSSEGDDFRDIVDDLTIKYQKLRARLKKLESMYGPVRQKDDSKLFEVRYYHVPREKRRELEDFLQAFTADLRSSSKSTNPTSPMVQSAQGQTTSMAIAPYKPSNLSAQQVITTLEGVLTPPPINPLVQMMMYSNANGWVFLNILNAMVEEIHDLGVPLEYLQHCVRTKSQKLELSEDGSKIRLRRKPSNAEGPSKPKPSEHFGIIDDHQDSTNISPTSNPPFTPRELQSRPRSFTNSVSPPASFGGATSTSSSSYFQPYTPIFSRSATNDSSSSSLTSIYSTSSSSSDGEKKLETAPIIYVEGGTFCLDLSKDNVAQGGENMVEVSKYDRATDIVLGEVIDMNPKGPPHSQPNKCFNCGSMEHSVQRCLEPRNENRIRTNKRIYAEEKGNTFHGRFHTEVEKSVSMARFKPGEISIELKRALGLVGPNNEGGDLQPERLPPYYYRMRIHGYPPGYLGFAEGDDPYEIGRRKRRTVTFDSDLDSASEDILEEEEIIKIFGNEDENASVAKETVERTVAKAANQPTMATRKRKAEEMKLDAGLEYADHDREMRRKIVLEMRRRKLQVAERKRRKMRLVKYPGMDWDASIEDSSMFDYGYGAESPNSTSLSSFSNDSNNTFSFSMEKHPWYQQQRQVPTTGNEYNHAYAHYTYDPQHYHQQQYAHMYGQYGHATHALPSYSSSYSAEAVRQWQNANYAYAAAAATPSPYTSFYPHPLPASSPYLPPPPPAAPSSLLLPAMGISRPEDVAPATDGDDMDISEPELEDTFAPYKKSFLFEKTHGIELPEDRTESSNVSGTDSSQRSSISSNSQSLPRHSLAHQRFPSVRKAGESSASHAGKQHGA